MEATGPQLVHELPIVQPLSRFAGPTELPKESIEVSKSPISKTKIPSRSMIPNKKPNNPSNETQKLTQKSNNSNSKRTPKLSDPQKITQSAESKAKPRSRVGSPTVRSTIPSQFPGISDQTPANLRTDRSPSSATRGRAAGYSAVAVNQKSEPNTPKSRRNSVSPTPSVGRERRLEPKKQEIRGNGGQILGSKMVDKVMNARKSNSEEKGGKLRSSRDSIDGNKGFGRMMTVKNSLETALKQSEIKGDRSSSRSRPGFFPITCSRPKG